MRTPSRQHELWLEHLLARARLLLVAGTVIAAYLDVFDASDATIAYRLLVAYAAWSVGLKVALQFTAAISRAQKRIIAAIDLLAAVALTTVTINPGAPAAAFILFVVVAAACRNGRRGAWSATAILGSLLILERVGVLLATGAVYTPVNLFAVRLTYLIVTGFIVASLADLQRELSAEVDIVAKALGCVRDARTYVTAVGAVAEQLTEILDATSVIIAIESPTADQYCWTVLRGANMSPEVRSLDASRNPVDHSVLDGPEPQTVLFRRDDSRRSLACIGSAPMLTRASRVPEAPFWKIVDCHSVLEHLIILDGGWQVRVYVPNPGRARSDIQAVQLLHTFGTQVAPALLKLFLARRLRSQAIARERARFSRELHDRVVQSLIALEIKVAVLSRRAAARPIAPELEELRTALQAEIADVRDLMQDLRPLRLKGADVPAFIEEMVARFQATTGIEARFECELDTVELLPHSCGELARLVQEALANVRKHSGATKVAVSLTRAPNSLVLTVHDNGRGFDFAGRVAAHTLPPQERPRMIEERARAIGASFSIESIPGSGARLDVTLPYAS